MRKLFFIVLGFLLTPNFPMLADNEVVDTLRSKQLDELLVSGMRAKSQTPVAYSNVSGKILQKENAASNLPMLLQNQTSLVAFTEGGTAVGNTSLRVRGTDATRINVTLNGMPLNNPESQEVYWVNLPDITASLHSIQLQRGVGSSTNGAAAFGASLSMTTAGGQPKAYATASTAVGSYNTFSSNIAAGSGILENGLSVDARFSRVYSDGYIRNGKVDHRNLYAALSHYTDRQLIRLIYMSGEQHTGITWEGVTAEQMIDKEFGRRYNSSGEYFDKAGNRQYYGNETDNYYSDIAQLLYSRHLSEALTLNANLSWNHGFGYYENYKTGRKYSSFGLKNQSIDGVTYKKSDMIRQKLMENDFYVANLSSTYTTEKLKIDAGVMLSRFSGEHYGKLPWIQYWENSNPVNLGTFEWYRNHSNKTEFNAFAKAQLQITSRLSAFVDLQGRFIRYEMKGIDDDFADLEDTNNYNFFNPKAGLFYQLNRTNSLYVSVAVGNREPFRADLKDSKKWGAKTEIQPEQMIDYELGYRYAEGNFTAGINLYSMNYNNQMVQTGRMSDSGYKLNENVKSSYRRGIELDAGLWMLNKKLKLDGNATLSQNKINDYTTYYDIYDENWEVVGQKTEFFNSSDISFSPSVIGSLALTYQPIAPLQLNLTGKYVGKQFLDNTSSDSRSLPEYFVSYFSAGYTFRKTQIGEITLQLFVNNLLNSEYIANGYASQSFMRDSNGVETASNYIGFYPQATRNMLVKMTIAL